MDKLMLPSKEEESIKYYFERVSKLYCKAKEYYGEILQLMLNVWQSISNIYSETSRYRVS